ncbi:SDR family NAD(P)-dependent oxidoreductase [Leptotrichia sp. OH3620_COT-345]|uniref:SDR family NAD(P)-dependent oxidoreductase n=1 Tax=Leptotrichia sp. OH3620_COT-345 TaxID=2491048 RepID=UPI000F650860|nr:SDR family NAD(P)-dependent oxidoreductase [Leptotrichia sp. OH3620_COT-345]RRD39545.1 SDR family NAD(P)-dependent oxidoreductase [Leptotrichia sp. OH3620_COT-345]
MSTVLITGGSSGIGKELAFLFAQRNYNLYLLAKSEEKLKKVQTEILNKYKINCDIIKYDLRELKKIEKNFEDLEADVLVNCAGIGEISSMDNISIEKELDIFKLNTIAPVILTRIFIKKYLLKKEGTVINICSTAALYPNPYLGAYSASKVSLLYYSLALDREVNSKNKNIRILSICPGPTATNFFNESTKRKFSTYVKYEMKVRDTAGHIIKAFDKKKSFTVIGFRNKFFVRMIRFLPVTAQTKIVEKFLKKGV